MTLTIVAAYCQLLSLGGLTHIAGSACALELHAYYPIRVALVLSPYSRT
jgi:hypothetical protein